MLAFLQAYSPPAFHASACAPRVLRVSIRLMQSDGAILITVEVNFYFAACCIFLSHCPRYNSRLVLTPFSFFHISFFPEEMAGHAVYPTYPRLY
jgi:hypothetical protein